MSVGCRVKKYLRPGDSIPESGVYRVFHDSHRLMHEATLLSESIFPRCRQCGDRVYFELARPAKEQLVSGSTHVLLEEWKAKSRGAKAS